MEKQFKEFSQNIRLTDNQEKDAKTKYTGVCKTLHNAYYNNSYDEKTKFLFGSYKTKTNIRPLSEDQDVDVLFKIPEETYNKFKNYNGNGPSALLQEIKGVLKNTYTTTDTIKGWGKVVLIKFSDDTHNVEVLPAFELENKTFKIPNSENGGSWDNFDPRSQIENFNSSNSKTNSLTADLTRMMKTWIKNTASLNYKSYNLLNDIINFLEKYYKNGANYSEYHLVIKDFFQYIKTLNSNFVSYIQTASDRVDKAIEFMNQENYRDASLEWRKIFGDDYPQVKENPIKENISIVNPPKLWKLN